MADPATNTNYPATIEPLPAIGSGSRMNDAETRHDVVHDRAHATLNAIQAIVGTTEDTDPASLIARVSALALGGILIQCGSKDAAAGVIPAATEISGIAPGGYVLTGWRLWVYPSGILEVDVRRDAFGSLPPDDTDSICGSGRPEVAGGASASGDVEGWSTSVARGDALTAVVTGISGVKWFALLLLGARA